MREAPVFIGFDRFIARRWADFALDLMLSKDPAINPYHHLRNWLTQEITGKEASRKTANQVKRLWMGDVSPAKDLRSLAERLDIAENPFFRPVLHYGMAINAFPILRDTCYAFGRLSKLQDGCSQKEIQHRVMEKHPNPDSIPRVIARVFQTLTDWGIVSQRNKKYYPISIKVDDQNLAVWITAALLINQPSKKMGLQDLLRAPEKLGLTLPEERYLIHSHSLFKIVRDGNGSEIINFQE